MKRLNTLKTNRYREMTAQQKLDAANNSRAGRALKEKFPSLTNIEIYWLIKTFIFKKLIEG
jgi:hypothetical protein